MKKCISKAIINNYDYFRSLPFIQGHLHGGGYERHFRDKVMDELKNLIRIGCCPNLSVASVVEKENKIPGLMSRKRTDITVTDGINVYIIEFGHYTTIQNTPKNAVNKPLSDIHKWLSLGYSNIYAVNVITHWINLPPATYPYHSAKALATRRNNLQFIEDNFYIIDSRLIKIVFRPTDDVEMHIYVKGPFNSRDWPVLVRSLSQLELNILKIAIP